MSKPLLGLSEKNEDFSRAAGETSRPRPSAKQISIDILFNTVFFGVIGFWGGPWVLKFGAACLCGYVLPDVLFPLPPDKRTKFHKQAGISRQGETTKVFWGRNLLFAMSVAAGCVFLPPTGPQIEKRIDRDILQQTVNRIAKGAEYASMERPFSREPKWGWNEVSGVRSGSAKLLNRDGPSFTIEKEMNGEKEIINCYVPPKEYSNARVEIIKPEP